MPDTLSRLLRPAAIAALLVLGGCGATEASNLSGIDNELLANGADPALTSALEDQILVDPNLVQQAHPNTVRPPEAPVQAQYPAGAAAAQAALSPSGCGVPFDYGAQWARRLPPEFPFYPGGRLTEAAGSDSGDCRMRVVTFRTADAHPRVLDHYRGLATRAGFSAEHQVRGADHVLGGVKGGTDGAYYLIVTPLQQGSDVALIINQGV